jgi:hypothetical protein
MRSSALASFFRYEGRRTRLFKRAEAAMLTFQWREGKRKEYQNRVEGKKRRKRERGAGGISNLSNPTGNQDLRSPQRNLKPMSPGEWKIWVSFLGGLRFVLALVAMRV